MKYDLLEYPGTGANLLHGEGGGVRAHRGAPNSRRCVESASWTFVRPLESFFCPVMEYV